ncbi:MULTISPECIES: TIR domain-containing protein [unclassified Thioalkalivibrio]|uniref:TIR domain-containing protein n=1 Tax=unclassified Thioalkalivibrio TaxID=2621013 RepID=UPI00039DF3BA|nr:MULTISPECIES: TIR domain-containing protein [unclassified Thioalkalivibrio]
MTLEEIKDALAEGGYEVKSENRAGNDVGWQLRLTNGGIVNVFDNGNFNVQGKCQPEIKEALGVASESSSAPSAQGQLKSKNGYTKVFVVYGHDETAKNHLEAMLRRWGLEPLILDQLPSEGQTLIEKLETYTAEVNFAVVLATPDDEGHRAGHDDEKALRARQNVVLEMGMLLSVLGRSRVAIVLNQQSNMERPSDIQGLIYIPYKDDLQKEAAPTLAKEMTAQGYHIDVAKL